MSKLFKQTTIGNGEPIKIKAGQKGVPVKWEFKDLTPEGIATYEENGETKYAITTGCSCTAKIEVKEDGVYAKYDDGGNKLNKKVKKNVFVYLQPSDDTPVALKTPQGLKINKEKLANVTLSFIVYPTT